MSASQVFLIVVSGLGVIHGLFLAIYLWSVLKGNVLANRLLGSLLVVLSFRVGKSVFLEFLENLDAKLIFIGLGTMMAIGPLFYLYTRAISDKSFQWSKNQLWHFIPCLLAILFGFWINDEDMETLPIALFLVLFLTYYIHYLIYLIITKRYISKQWKNGLSDKTYKLLTLLFYGLLIIWIAYVLNLFDESIPYVIGPVLYSIVAYVISFIVISKGYLQDVQQDKYKTTRVSDQQMEQLFSKVSRIIIDEKQFKNAELTLKSLSADLKVSTQVLSMVINRKSQKNFNAFVNQYRIQEAIELLMDVNNQHQTISAIAYEVGFNSISSFNSAFKKQTDKTPQVYRQQLMN
ncbi:helix-turn-helix domain-containing protein [Reichenbachiella versicolor]|uniref:helix-turn-helix domain-containing protein n=1 Tax=Reichenbachiella versicolor TaxID=1821036 RepID=UPI000D6E819F|nr:helix-turn-helix domain-containing protein [Reichenbachiella versicolor]